MFLKLEGRHVLVVGAGKVGEPKIQGLLATGAQIHVVAIQASEATRQWARTGAITLHERAFVSTDLDGVFLVVVATALRELNQHVFEEAQRRGILCNVVDVPHQCDFFYGAVVQRGALQIAISTAGNSPSLAQRIRKQLERQFGAGYARWVADLGATRSRVLASDLAPERKRELLHSLASEHAFEAAVESELKLREKAAVL